MKHSAEPAVSSARNQSDSVSIATERLSSSLDGFSRTLDGHIRSWPACMEQRYGFTAKQAIGQISHLMLRTTFPIALRDIEATLLKQDSWHGGLIQRHADGRPIIVMSHWDLHRHGGQADDATVAEVHSDTLGIELADLLAILANELSQPLSAIANYVNGARRVLRRNRPDPKTALMAMTMANVQIERGAAQVKLIRRLAEDLRHTG